MLSSAVIAALVAGLPVPEFLGRPVVERLELLDRFERYDSVVWRPRVIAGAKLPFISEAGYLPSRDYCEDALIFNRAHASWLDDQQRMNIDRDYSGWIEENDKLRDWWYAAKDANVVWYTLFTRRRKLGEAKDKIGREKFYARVFPPIVPLWRFRDE
jgi:hypothetical protein